MLASASPRRREILSAAGISFDVVPANIDESTRPGESPRELALRLAREKARAVQQRLDAAPRRPVLGADTIVVCDEAVLGKPRDEAHAVELLSSLVGRRHQVMTGICVGWTHRPDSIERVVTSEVAMRHAKTQELEEYVALGESLDKAGGYALQGEGQRFIESVQGSRSNVIGLPLEETLELLDAAGFATTSRRTGP